MARIVIYCSTLTLARELAALLPENFVGAETEWQRGSDNLKPTGYWWSHDDWPDGFVKAAVNAGAESKTVEDLPIIQEWALRKSVAMAEHAAGMTVAEVTAMLSIIERERTKDATLETATATARAEVGGE